MATKKEILTAEVAKVVGAGKVVALSTVDFGDPNRPKTCLELDFPILPVNQVATIEGNAGKPIYQMAKWWARRRSSVFRSMLIAAATKAPDDSSHAAKLVWDNYYANHAKRGTFSDLRVADIFMGGGTTLVEGSRLGMKMTGNDLNPVAWFVVKQSLADVGADEVKRLLADIEADVKPQIMPFYFCDGPGGEKGSWIEIASGRVMDADFDPLDLSPVERKRYRYNGPELVVTFWAKHGPCQVTGCGHKTPLLTTPIFAVKSLSVKFWSQTCKACGCEFDAEQEQVRLAPDAPLYVSPEEKPYATLSSSSKIRCPRCDNESLIVLSKADTKSVNLALLVTPEWLAGSKKQSKGGKTFGGSVGDDVEATAAWSIDRTSSLDILEVRGLETLVSTDPDTGETKTQKIVPAWVVHPSSGERFRTDQSGGNVPKKSKFACAECGTLQDVLKTVSASQKTAPVAAYAVQAWSPNLKGAYGGRFFALPNTSQIEKADREWHERSQTDLAPYYTKLDIDPGLETTVRTALGRYGYKKWSDTFNSRQLLANALLLKAIDTVGEHRREVREFVLAAFQQYVRNNNMFCIWNIQGDKLEPFLSKNNLQPPTRPIENNVFGPVGRGNWSACTEGLIETLDWRSSPWEIVSREVLGHDLVKLMGTAKGIRVETGDSPQLDARITCESSTELVDYDDASFDLVITDPPFGDIMQYAELSSTFYGWLTPVLGKTSGNVIPEKIPTALEAVENKARHGEGSGQFYARLLEGCWKEANRILKPGGILAFTFHHDKDEPWVAVLESLFNAGFYLEATYPIRSDETKGEGGTPGTFGAQKVEYDIIHVCRKRTEDPKPVSWARMRREVLQDVRRIEAMLSNHAKAGLPAADIQVIRRGKALEYFSRHYGKVFVEEDRTLTVAQALLGINQLIEEETEVAADLPPASAEPLTRQFIRIYRGKDEVDRDQLKKFLRGTGISPEIFVEHGWAYEEAKRFKLVSPTDFALRWKGKQRKSLVRDYDQTWYLIGACHDGVGINIAEQLRNENFKPHPAVKPMLEWFGRNAADARTRQAAVRASTIYNAWAESNPAVVSKQLEMFT